MKAHFVSSETPLPVGQSLVAACGTPIKKSYFCMSIDTSGVTGRTVSAMISANTLLICRKCQVAPLPGTYLYMVTESTDKLEEKDAAPQA